MVLLLRIFFNSSCIFEDVSYNYSLRVLTSKSYGVSYFSSHTQSNNADFHFWKCGLMRIVVTPKVMIRQCNRRRRGLASVVTGAILLSAVALLGTGLVSWTNSSLSTHQQDLQSSYSTVTNKINEFLIIENVWFGQTPHKFVNITITNVGNVGLNVTKIELTNSTHSVEYQFGDGAILPKKSYSPPISYEWGNNELVDITITTSRGSIYKTQALP